MKNKLLKLFSIFSALTSMTSCSLNYDIDEVNNIIIGYSKIERSAFIGAVGLYPESMSDNNIELPDEYDGIPVKELGGYYGRGVPTPFCIECIVYREEASCYSTDYRDDEDYSYLGNYEVHSIYVNVTLPKKLENINFAIKNVIVLEFVKEDGTTFNDLYIVKCSFNIDESNKYFYCSEGKLYYKKTDELVSRLIYK